MPPTLEPNATPHPHADSRPNHTHTQSPPSIHSPKPPKVMRLSSQDVPTAYAYELEAATIVQPEQVVDAVESMCAKVAARA